MAHKKTRHSPIRQTGIKYRLIQQESGYWRSAGFIDNVREQELEIDPQMSKEVAIMLFNRRIERINNRSYCIATLPPFDLDKDYCEVCETLF